MTEMERVVWEAWERVWPGVVGDAGEMGRRRGRRAGVLRDWPVGACVAVRAGDVRLVGVGESLRGEAREEVRLTGRLVRELVRGVEIRGEKIGEAAKRLGVSEGVLGEWLRSGRGKGRAVAVDRRGEAGVLPHQVELLEKLWQKTGKGGGESEEAGKLVARGARRLRVSGEEGGGRVFWPGGAVMGGRGDPAWAGIRRGLVERVPEEFEQVLRRERTETEATRHGKRVRVWGRWMWVCSGCGRKVSKVYLRLRVFSLPEFLGVEGFGGGERWAEKGEGGEMRCERCCRVVNKGSWTVAGWNLAVAHLSGGMLYGREVERPGEAAEWKERAEGSRRRVFPAPVRGEVLRRLGEGKSVAEIAAGMGMTVRNVRLLVVRARRKGLVGRLRRPRVKMEAVERRLREGMRPGEIAEELGMSVGSVYMAAYTLRKEGKVGSLRVGRRNKKKAAIGGIAAGGIVVEEVGTGGVSLRR